MAATTPMNKELLVEVDFDHSSLDVILRLYRLLGPNKSILRVQEIYNLSRKIRQSQEDGWNENDRKFLKEIWPIINKPGVIKTNLEVIKLPRPRFDRILAKWADTADRFVERKSQAAISSDLPVATLHFRLENHGNLCLLSASLTTPGGATFDYCDIDQSRKTNKNEILYDGNFYHFDCPLKEDIMNQVFGKRNPEIPTSKIAENLPAVLGNRLDLLKGTAVKHIDRIVELTVKLEDDGADIVISALAGRRPLLLQPNQPLCASMHLVRCDDVFEVHHYKGAELEHVIAELTALPITLSATGRYVLSPTVDNITRLHNLHSDVHDRVSFDISKNLQGIFEVDSRIEATIFLEKGTGWTDIDVHCHINNCELDQRDIEELLDNNLQYFRTRDGRWLRISLEKLAELRTQIGGIELGIGSQRVAVSRISDLVNGLNRIPDLRIHRSSSKIFEELVKISTIAIPKIQSYLSKHLRHYQADGVDFLLNRKGYGLGCILADDMGLGKTRQVLAYLETIRKNSAAGLPSLVICPASVVDVWVTEAQNIAPDLRIISTAVPIDTRREIIADSDNWDVLVATYAVVRNDIYHLKKISFHGVVLDEAQQIKNPDAAITRAVKTLVARHRIAVTGTPLENRISDLWSIVDFLNPGYLEDHNRFKEKFGDSRYRNKQLSRMISPLILRRLKESVAPELPPRIVETLTIPLSETQNTVYQKELQAIKKSVNKTSAVDIFAALTRLRQICCHPTLLPKNRPDRNDICDSNDVHALVAESSKLDCLINRLLELREEGHSALVFSQFTSMLEIIEKCLVAHQFNLFKITGETAVDKRPQLVNAFQKSEESAVFLLSLRAAGTGLTLTKADYIFIFDPWWNPAVENQAIDRSHRIGQMKPVIAYRLVTSGTIEQEVTKMQAAKRELFASVFDGTQQLPSNLSVDDFVGLLDH